MAAPQQGGFNVNTAAAQGIQQAGMATGAEMGYRPMAITAPSQANLQQYTNPYENQVVNQSLSDIERSRLMQQNTGGAQASAASGLRQSGYQNSQDMARQAQMQNQQAGLQGSQQRLGAANQMGNMSNLGFGMGQTIQGRMDQQGAMQQQQQQALINQAKAAMAGYTGSPANSLQYLLSALGQAPNVGSTTTEKEPGLFDYLSLGLGAT